MGKSYHLKEQKISYKKNAFLEDHGGGEDIPTQWGMTQTFQKIAIHLKLYSMIMR